MAVKLCRTAIGARPRPSAGRSPATHRPDWPSRRAAGSCSDGTPPPARGATGIWRHAGHSGRNITGPNRRHPRCSRIGVLRRRQPLVHLVAELPDLIRQVLARRRSGDERNHRLTVSLPPASSAALQQWRSCHQMALGGRSAVLSRNCPELRQFSCHARTAYRLLLSGRSIVTIRRKVQVNRIRTASLVLLLASFASLHPSPAQARDKDQNRRDRYEDRWDRREDQRDRQEDRWIVVRRSTTGIPRSITGATIADTAAAAGQKRSHLPRLRQPLLLQARRRHRGPGPRRHRRWRAGQHHRSRRIEDPRHDHRRRLPERLSARPSTTATSSASDAAPKRQRGRRNRRPRRMYANRRCRRA